jgi:hypothetical protein
MSALIEEILESRFKWASELRLAKIVMNGHEARRLFAEITSISLSSLWCVARENRAHHGSECGTNVQ